MVPSVVGQGIYAGIPYLVCEKGGKRYIALPDDAIIALTGLGVDLRTLDDIGDQDPDEVMATLFESIPEEGGDE